MFVEWISWDNLKVGARGIEGASHYFAILADDVVRSRKSGAEETVSKVFVIKESREKFSIFGILG